MKKWIALSLVLVLVLGLAGCGDKNAASSGSAAQEKDYAQILMDARSDEENEYNVIITGKNGQDPTVPNNINDMDEEGIKSSATMMFETLGVDPASLDGYAFSMSMMNIRAYAVGVFKPAEGKSEEVTQALQNYVTAQQKAFENYLADQYEVAKGTILRTNSAGEIVLVMSEDATALASSIEKALK